MCENVVYLTNSMVISAGAEINAPRGAHIVWETMVLRRPKRSVERSDSVENVSAYADQNHASSLTCVRLEYKRSYHATGYKAEG